MRKPVRRLSAAAMIMTLAACGTDQPENNLTAEDVNAMTNLVELTPPEPAANEVVEAPAAEPQQGPTAPKPAAPAQPAPAKPKPPAPEPAPDPHAGHDMNNMSH